MNMLKNLLFIIRITNTNLVNVAAGEMLHGIFLAAPTGILLLIIWELFKAQPSSGKIWSIIIVLALMFVLQLYVAGKVMTKTNESVYTMTSKLRLMLGDHLQKLSLGVHKKRDPGDLASVVLQDVSNFESVFPFQFQNIVSALFGTLFLSVFLLVLDWKLAVITLSAIPCALIVMVLAANISEKFSRRHITSRNETGSRFIEYILGVQYLKAFNLTGERFSALKKAFEDLRVNSIKLESVFTPLIICAVMVFEFFFLLMICSAISRFNLVNGATITIPVFVAFLILGYRLYTPLQGLIASYAELSYINTSMERIRQLLETSLQDTGRDLRPDRYDIVFKDVGFSYTDNDVLHNINLSISENKLTALVGASGAGKTTITSLIARFWDIRKGQITIGGVDVKDMSPQTVYSLISEVFQEVYLFDDTIYNNIKIGNPDASEDQIMQAAEKAQVTEFLPMLPNGIQTRVGEGGSRLSGGQKQRISIARAMLKDAPIILLDEATAALDPENEIYIQLAIQELVRKKTVVVIAHKLQTIRNADKIFVLKNGRICETGSHQELMGKQGLYAQYWNIQQTTGGWKIEDLT